MHFPQRSQPESSLAVIGDWPRLHTTSQAVQLVHRARSFFTWSTERLPSKEKAAPPGQSERQKPARETKVSKRNAASTREAPAPSEP